MVFDLIQAALSYIYYSIQIFKSLPLSLISNEEEEVILEFSKDIFDEYKRKNAVTITNISTVLIEAAMRPAFVNESCKSTKEISKSQIIYRKLGMSITEVEFAFRIMQKGS